MVIKSARKLLFSQNTPGNKRIFKKTILKKDQENSVAGISRW